MSEPEGASEGARRRAGDTVETLVTAAPSVTREPGSARKRELLEAAYGYVLGNGLADMSLRPLAKAIGSSPRVLLFLFGSKEGLIRALLARAREDELGYLGALRGSLGMAATEREIWSWLAAAPRAARPVGRGLRPVAARRPRTVGGLRRGHGPRLARPAGRASARRPAGHHGRGGPAHPPARGSPRRSA